MQRTKLISPVAFEKLKKTCNSRVVPIDATWYLPNVPKNGFDEFKKQRIPNAVFFDIDRIKEVDSVYPHMLPKLEMFNTEMGKLGIANNDILVVYDQNNNFSAPRAAWMLDVFHHQEVYLLDNLNKYLDLQFDLDKSPVEKESEYKPVSYSTNEGIDLQNDVIDFDEYFKIINNEELASKYYLLDARPEGRYEGTVPEPRPGLTSGHAPFVKSTPALLAFDHSKDELFLDKSHLQEWFSSKGVDDSKPIIVSCGTGVSACIIKTALDIANLGSKGIKIYDGSWTEFASKVESKFIIKKVD